MKNNATLQLQFRQRKAYLEAWGKLVTDTVVAGINEKYADPRFFEVPPGHRVKDEASFMAKAFSPKKNYADPINNIEDQVGVRFVVLLMAQVRKIGDIIEAESSWVSEKARNLLTERENEPASFGYQSDHYVVRNRKSIPTDNEVIPAGTPCEIQIRTLLQHAYSQLTHDLSYKPKQAVTPAIHRCNARSMALIEVTDDLFAKAFEAQILATRKLKESSKFVGFHIRRILPMRPNATPVLRLRFWMLIRSSFRSSAGRFWTARQNPRHLKTGRQAILKNCWPILLLQSHLCH